METMSATKTIIMKDQASKKWLQEDCDKRFDDDPFQAIGTAITLCIAAIVAILVGLAAFLVFGGVWS